MTSVACEAGTLTLSEHLGPHPLSFSVKVHVSVLLDFAFRFFDFEVLVRFVGPFGIFLLFLCKARHKDDVPKICIYTCLNSPLRPSLLTLMCA